MLCLGNSPRFLHLTTQTWSKSAYLNTQTWPKSAYLIRVTALADCWPVCSLVGLVTLLSLGWDTNGRGGGEYNYGGQSYSEGAIRGIFWASEVHLQNVRLMTNLVLP